MDNGQDILDGLNAAKAALGNIKQDITDIKNSLPASGGMSAEKTAAVRTSVGELLTEMNALDLENPGTTTPPTSTEVSTCNQAGQDAGACALGEVIANDNPSLASLKANGYVDTVTS